MCKLLCYVRKDTDFVQNVQGYMENYCMNYHRKAVKVKPAVRVVGS